MSLNDHWLRFTVTFCIEKIALTGAGLYAKEGRDKTQPFSKTQLISYEDFTRRRLAAGSLSGSTSCSLFHFVAIIVRHVPFSSFSTFRITGRVIERPRVNFKFFRTSMSGCTCKWEEW